MKRNTIGITIIILSSINLKKITCRPIFNPNKGLGLLIENNEILIPKDPVIQNIALMVHTKIDAEGIHEIFNEIKALADKFLTIKGIKDNENRKKDVKNIIADTEAHLASIEISLLALNKIRNENIPNEEITKYSCNIAIKAVGLEDITKLKNSITELTNFIKFDTTDANGPMTYEELLETLNIINLKLLTPKQTLFNRMGSVNKLLGGEISDEMISNLDFLACIPDGHFEDISIMSCSLNIEGIKCILNGISFKEINNYIELIPINYNNIQLSAEKVTQRFALDANNKIGFFKCNFDDEDRESLEKEILNELDCKFINLFPKCAQALENNHYDSILKNCNFSTITPNTATQLREGILIMGTNDIKITENPKDGKALISIPNTRPVLIKTPNDLELMVGNSLLTFKNTLKVNSRNLIYTYLDGEFIEKIKKYAEWIDYINYFNYSDYIDLGIVGILAIFTTCTSILCYYKIKRSDYCQKKRDYQKRNNAKCKTKNPQTQNYEENKNFLIRTTEIK